MLKLFAVLLLSFLCGCSTTSQLLNETPAPNSNTNPQALLNEPQVWQSNPTVIWNKLQHFSTTKLQTTLTQTNDPTAVGWLTLAIISKKYSTNSEDLTQQLMNWRKEYPNHAANTLFPDNATLMALQTTPMPKKIALLLPLDGPLSAQGQTVRDGFLNAYYEAARKNQQTIFFVNTSKTTNMTALYQQAIAQGADTIVGPLTKENVMTLKKQGTFPIPTLALNYTDIGFGSLPTHFYEYGLSIHDEAEQMADKAVQMGHLHALVIAPQNEWGQRLSKPLIARFQSLGGSITDTLYYTPTSDLSQDVAALLHINTQEDRKKMQDDNDKKTLEQQRRQDFDVVFLIAQPQMARQIVPLLKYYYVSNIPIIASSAIYTGSPDPQKDMDLNDVYFCDIPWVFKSHHGSNQQANRLYAVGIDSYTISNNIPRLAQLPYFPIYGTTGALSLTTTQQIYRRLPWTQMHAGQPQ